MKSEKGITLASLVIYIALTTATLVMMASLNSYMTRNFKKIGTDSISPEEFNKFNVQFIKDVKQSRKAEIKYDKSSGNYNIIFEDGANYNYIEDEKAIYKNEQKIAKNIVVFEAQSINNEETNNKNVIKVRIGTGKEKDDPNYGKTINYVLKYW